MCCRAIIQHSKGVHRCVIGQAGTLCELQFSKVYVFHGVVVVQCRCGDKLLRYDLTKKLELKYFVVL